MKNIFRIERREKGFVQIDRIILENDQLSWKAKGLLCYLLSRPDEWKVQMGDLINRSTDGTEATRTALAELARNGHARLEQMRNDNGTLTGTRWVIMESPGTKPPKANREEQTEMAVSRVSDKPDADFPHTDNRLLSNKEFNDNKKTVGESLEAESIYLTYPRRVGRGDAIKSIIKALRKVPSGKLMSATSLFALAVSRWPLDRQRFVPHPATWFNRESYLDDPNTWEYQATAQDRRQEREQEERHVYRSADEGTA